MTATPEFTRWTPRRKLSLLAQIRHRQISRERAEREYGLSAEELASWERDFRARGRFGLAVKEVQWLRRERASGTLAARQLTGG